MTLAQATRHSGVSDTTLMRLIKANVLVAQQIAPTAARSAEVRKATWNEIDIAGATWTVPAARMKANREHRVPLSGWAMEVLVEAGLARDHPECMDRLGASTPWRTRGVRPTVNSRC